MYLDGSSNFGRLLGESEINARPPDPHVDFVSAGALVPVGIAPALALLGTLELKECSLDFFRYCRSPEAAQVTLHAPAKGAERTAHRLAPPCFDAGDEGRFERAPDRR